MTPTRPARQRCFTWNMLRSALLIACTIIAAGCGSNAAAPSPILTLRTMAAPSPLDSSNFELSLPAEQLFSRDINGKPAPPLLRTQATTDRFGAQIETIDTSEGQPLRTLYWSREDSGDYVLHATIEHADNALTILDPPLLLLPATITPGVPVTAQSSMRILRADDPRRQREQGTATQTITLIDRRQIRTPHEQSEALYFEIEFHADLRLADIRETTLHYRDPHTGDIIAEHNRQRIRILALPPSDDVTTLIRTPH